MALVATLCACAPTVVWAGSASADWQLQTHLGGDGIHTALLDIACPSKSFCVAVGEPDRVLSSTNPTGGASAWQVVQPEGEAMSECHSHWIPPCRDPKDRMVKGVSCPSPQLCVAVTPQGYIYASTDPTGSGDDWGVADIDGNGADTHLTAVSCPSPSLCVAVSGERNTAGKILSSTNPTGGASAWQVLQLDESLDLRGVSCGTPSFCVAVAQEGRLLTSTNPTGDASAWKEVGKPGGTGNLQGVSCAAAFCVAGNSGGNLLTSTNPGGAASTWDEASGGGSVQITGVDCLPSRQCIATDNNGNVLTSNDPTAGRRAWSLVNLIPYEDPAKEYELPFNALFGASCPSSSFCAISAADGRIFTNTDPFAGSPDSTGPGKQKTSRRPRRPRVTIATAHAGYRVRNPHRKSGVFFRFHANGKVRGFLCKRDRGPFKHCRSPVRYRAGLGNHVFKVRAVGLTGLRGPIVSEHFKVELNQHIKR